MLHLTKVFSASNEMDHVFSVLESVYVADYSFRFISIEQSLG